MIGRKALRYVDSAERQQKENFSSASSAALTAKAISKTSTNSANTASIKTFSTAQKQPQKSVTTSNDSVVPSNPNSNSNNTKKAGLQLSVSGISAARRSVGSSSDNPEDLMQVIEESFARRGRLSSFDRQLLQQQLQFQQELAPEEEVITNRKNPTPPAGRRRQIASLRAIYSQSGRPRSASAGTSPSWSIASDVAGSQGTVVDGAGRRVRPGSAISELIQRFRNAPAAPREERAPVSDALWWKQSRKEATMTNNNSTATPTSSVAWEGTSVTASLDSTSNNNNNNNNVTKKQRRSVRSRSDPEVYFSELTSSVDSSSIALPTKQGPKQPVRNSTTSTVTSSLDMEDRTLRMSTGSVLSSGTIASEVSVGDSDVDASLAPRASPIILPSSSSSTAKQSETAAKLAEAEDVLAKWRNEKQQQQQTCPSAQEEAELEAAVSRVRKRLGLDNSSTGSNATFANIEDSSVEASVSVSSSYDFPSKLRQVVRSEDGKTKTKEEEPKQQQQQQEQDDDDDDQEQEETVAPIFNVKVQSRKEAISSSSTTATTAVITTTANDDAKANKPEAIVNKDLVVEKFSPETGTKTVDNPNNNNNNNNNNGDNDYGEPITKLELSSSQQEPQEKQQQQQQRSQEQQKSLFVGSEFSTSLSPPSSAFATTIPDDIGNNGDNNNDKTADDDDLDFGPVKLPENVVLSPELRKSMKGLGRVIADELRLSTSHLSSSSPIATPSPERRVRDVKLAGWIKQVVDDVLFCESPGQTGKTVANAEESTWRSLMALHSKKEVGVSTDDEDNNDSSINNYNNGSNNKTDKHRYEHVSVGVGVDDDDNGPSDEEEVEGEDEDEIVQMLKRKAHAIEEEIRSLPR